MVDEAVEPVRGTVEITRWGAVCKDCLREDESETFAYPDAWIQGVIERGGSRSDRCPKHRQKHARDARTLAAPYIDLEVIGRVRDREFPTGSLGGLGPLPIEHTPIPEPRKKREARLATYDFGLKDKDILELLAGLAEKQVAVVVAGTGTGKSTFLPYRLLMPPEGAAFQPADRGPIVVTEPRRAATTDTATFVATELHESTVGAGSDIGYRVQGEPAYDSACRLLYVTDGSLINWLRDGSFKRFGCIMVDEAHERSKNIDIILGLLREALPRHPHLKLIIASATIDPRFFIEYFGGESNVFFKEYPAHKHYGYGVPLYPGEQIDLGHPDWDRDEREEPFPENWQKPFSDLHDLRSMTERLLALRVVEKPLDPKSWPNKMPGVVAEQVLRILEETKAGDILAFLPGKSTIDRAVDLIRERAADNVDVYALLRTTPPDEQRAARGDKKDPERRHVVVSTNIAETSLTIDGITFVVDSGLIHQSKWDPDTATKRVPATVHSQHGVRQRWGRVGRKAPGWAFPLYTKEQFEKVLPEHTPPESTRDDLEQFFLTAVAAGVEKPESFAWPAVFERSREDGGDDRFEKDRSEKYRITFEREIRRAERALKARGAVDDDGDVTPVGSELQAFPGSMVDATALVLADRLSCAIEVVTALQLLRGWRLVGSLFLWERKWDAARKNDARRIHQSWRAGCVDELDIVLKVFAAWEAASDREAWARANFIDHGKLSKAETDRATVLEPLSPGKKTQEIRELLPELAPRVRAVLSYALRDLTYERTESGWEPLRPEQKTTRLRWEIDPFAVCHGADRVIAFQRQSAQGGKVLLSNMVRACEWADMEHGGWIDFLLESVSRLRGTEEGRAPNVSDYLALMEEWRVGERYRCVAERAENDEIRICAVEKLGMAVDGPLTDREAEQPVSPEAVEENDLDEDGSEAEMDGDEETDPEPETRSDSPPTDDLHQGDTGRKAETIVAGAATSSPHEVVDDPERDPLEEDPEPVEEQEPPELADEEPEVDAVIAEELAPPETPEEPTLKDDIVSLAPQGVLDLSQEEQYVDPASLEAPDEEEAGEAEAPADLRSEGADRIAELKQQRLPESRPAVRALGRELSEGEVFVRVLGYEGLGEDRRLLVAPYDPAGTSPEGGETTNRETTVAAIEAVRGWGRPFLAAIEGRTGAEVALDMRDLGLGDQTVNLLNLTPPGTEFSVTLLDERLPDHTMAASRQTQIAEHLAAASRVDEWDPPLFPARVAGTDPRGREVYIDLEHGDPETGMIHRFAVKRGMLDRAGVLLEPGTRLGVQLSLPTADEGTDFVSVKIKKIKKTPPGLADLLGEEPTKLTKSGRKLRSKAMMSLDLRNRLYALQDSRPWRELVECLWLASLNVRISDVRPATSLEDYVRELERLFPEGQPVPATVTGFLKPRHVWVRLQNGRSELVHGDNIGPDGVLEPERYLHLNDEVEVIPGKVVTKDGRVAGLNLQLRDEGIPPLHEQLEEKVGSEKQVSGVIHSIPDAGLKIHLDIGLSTVVYPNKVGPEGTLVLADHFAAGKPVTVTVDDISSRSGRTRLVASMPDADVPPLAEQVKKRFPGTPTVRATVGGVAKKAGVYARLPGGYSALVPSTDIGSEGLLFPEDYYESRDPIEVRILGVEPREGKATVKMDAPAASVPPLLEQARRHWGYENGETIAGQVREIKPGSGVRVGLPDGYSGLARQDAIGSDGVYRIEDYEHLFPEGAPVDVEIRSVRLRRGHDWASFQFDLALPKAPVPTREEQLADRYPIGSSQKATVVPDHSGAGLGVELPGGQRALARAEDIGPHGVTLPYRHYKPRQQVQVKVKEIGRDSEGNPAVYVSIPDGPSRLKHLRKRYWIDSVYEGTITELDNVAGVRVKLERDIVGLVPHSAVGDAGLIDLQQQLHVGQKIKVRIRAHVDHGRGDVTVRGSLPEVSVPPLAVQINTILPAGTPMPGVVRQFKDDYALLVELDAASSLPLPNAFVHLKSVGPQGTIDIERYFNRGDRVIVHEVEWRLKDSGQWPRVRISASMKDAKIPSRVGEHMTTPRLPSDIIQQLSPLLENLACIVIAGSQLTEDELAMLLLGAGLEAEPAALDELKLWGKILLRLQEQRSKLRSATVEALRLRGLPKVSASLAVDIVASGESEPQSGAKTVVKPEQLESAVHEAPAGAVLHLSAGEHRLSRPLTIDKPLSLMGEGMEKTCVLCDGRVVKFVGDGPFVVHDVSFEVEGEFQLGNVVEVYGGEIDIQRCRFDGARRSRHFGPSGSASGLYLHNQTTGSVIDCESVQNLHHGIEIKEQAQPTLENNTCKNNHDSGIAYFGSAAGIARHNTSSNNWDHGIYVGEQAQPTLESNICQDNHDDGIAYRGSAVGIARHNTSSNNWDYGISVLQDAHPTLEANSCTGNGEEDVDLASTAYSVAKNVEVVNPWVPTVDGPEWVFRCESGHTGGGRFYALEECFSPGTTFEAIAPGWTGDVARDADGKIELLGWNRDLRIRANRRLTPECREEAVKLGLLELASEVPDRVGRSPEGARTRIYDEREIEFLETLQDTELAEGASRALDDIGSVEADEELALRRAFPGDFEDL